jgi:hypothetical protein
MNSSVTTCIYGISSTAPIYFYSPSAKACSAVNPSTTGYGNDACAVNKFYKLSIII